MEMYSIDLIKHDKKLLQIDAVLTGFGISQKDRNLIFQIDSALKDGEQTWDDFLYYIRETDIISKAETARHNAEIKEVNRHFRQQCPTCEKVMHLFSVNTTPGDQTGDPTDKSVWVCHNAKCRETIYNKETVDTIFQRNRREGGR